MTTPTTWRRTTSSVRQPEAESRRPQEGCRGCKVGREPIWASCRRQMDRRQAASRTRYVRRDGLEKEGQDRESKMGRV